MPNLSFIGKPLPSEAANTHFCFIGATGSGKTVGIRILMQSALPEIGKGQGHRALVYDAKRDMLPVLAGIIDARHIKTLNPFDERSFAWDMAKDIKTPANALQLASILVPPEKNASQPFFSDATRHLLMGVVLSFIINSKENWTFRDVVYSMLDREIMIDVLRNADATKGLVDLYFSHEGTSQNIMSTVATKLNAYSIVAALWDKAYWEGNRISLKEWLQSESVLVLGNDHTNRVAVDALNQVIFKRISELILDQDDIVFNDGKPPARTWVFFDEFVRAGKLEGMVELATVGRSKGAAIVLGFQDIDGARAVYGKEVAEEIIGQCSNIAILRLQSPETAEWASKLFGSYEKIEQEYSENEGESDSLGVFGLLNKGSSTGKGVTWRKQLRQAVLSSEFMSLPMTNSANGIKGFLFSPFFSNGKFLQEHAVSGKAIFGGLCDKAKLAGIKPRDGKQQYLSAWEESDWNRLGLINAYLKATVRETQEQKQEQEKQIKNLAHQLQRDQANELLTNELASLNPLRANQLKRELKKIELEQCRSAEEERKRYLETLAELWVARNPTKQELDEISGLSEDEQQEFYGMVEGIRERSTTYVVQQDYGQLFDEA
jgi:hypothetical protein